MRNIVIITRGTMLELNKKEKKYLEDVRSFMPA
jgi:hypothetical protein